MRTSLHLLALLLTAALVMPTATATPAAARGYQVVGGQPAEPGAWPSVVAIVRAEDPDDVTGQFCAGTAVAPDLVVTAAHCVHSATGDVTRGPDQLRVVAGRTELSGTGGVELAGTEIHVHPAYDARRRRHDVAVIRVAGDLGVPVQQLADIDAPQPTAGTGAVILGWGRTGSGDEEASRTTSELHQADVPVVDTAACDAAYEGTLDPTIHLCAGGGGSQEEPAADTCNGDSGGPLLLRQDDGEAIQIGITSFGPTPCGVEEPGVYVRVAGVRDFVDEVIAGRHAPTILPGVQPPVTTDGAVRVADPASPPSDPITQAVAVSRAVFDDGRAQLAVVARVDAFSDALAGSTLGYGRGPLLLTPATGPLAAATRDELVRVVQPGAVVYLLGGTSAVPQVVADELAALGFQPRRLAGEGREATAAEVGREVVRRHGDGVVPWGTVVLATSHSWPDAVLAGQVGAWWGTPILLTPTESLHPATAAVLQELAPRRLLVIGGQGAIAEDVVAAARDLLGDVEVARLAGGSRTETGIAVARWHADQLNALGERPPDAVVAVNLRREDGYAHALVATPLLGATAGVILPVEGEDGGLLTSEVVEAFCGSGGMVVVVGGRDVVTDSVAARLPGIVDGSAC